MSINENLLKNTRTQAGILFGKNELYRSLKHSRYLLLCMLFLPWSACYAQPAGATAVSNFSLQNYLGTWYEIARLDHRFERGLSQVTAHYSMREDGGVRVLNRGYSDRNGKSAEPGPHTGLRHRSIDLSSEQGASALITSENGANLAHLLANNHNKLLLDSIHRSHH